MSTPKRADQLVPGDVIDNHSTIRTVTHTQVVGFSGDHVLLVFADGTVDIVWPDTTFDIPTDEQIAEQRQAIKREDMARALEFLAKLIREHKVAPTLYSIDVHVATRTIAELETWAAALDGSIEGGGTNGTIPVIRARETKRFGDIQLDVHAQASEPMPAPRESGESE